MSSCFDCGIRYGGDAWIEMVIPDKVWNKIKPRDCDEGAGLLCPACIARRLNIKGFKNVPAWMCGTEPLKFMEGDPSENLDVLRKWDQEI